MDGWWKQQQQIFISMDIEVFYCYINLSPYRVLVRDHLQLKLSGIVTTFYDGVSGKKFCGWKQNLC